MITYIRTQRDLVATRLFEAKKPFTELRLKLYTEASQVAAKLVSSTFGDEQWNKAIYRFWELYWSELSMVEDARVEKAMTQKPVSPGRARYKPLTPLRREGRSLRSNL